MLKALLMKFCPRREEDGMSRQWGAGPKRTQRAWTIPECLKAHIENRGGVDESSRNTVDRPAWRVDSQKRIGAKSYMSAKKLTTADNIVTGDANARHRGAIKPAPNELMVAVSIRATDEIYIVEVIVRVNTIKCIVAAANDDAGPETLDRNFTSIGAIGWLPPVGGSCSPGSSIRGR
jgi:hypothetical protein